MERSPRCRYGTFSSLETADSGCAVLDKSLPIIVEREHRARPCEQRRRLSIWRRWPLRACEAPNDWCGPVSAARLSSSLTSATTAPSVASARGKLGGVGGHEILNGDGQITAR